MNKNNNLENAKRFVRDLAFWNEANPDEDPEVNEFWAKIREKYEMDCLKWGKCEVCGEEGVTF